MDEKIIASKEQKRVSLLLSIELCTLTAVNALLGIFRTKGYSALVPASIALCGVSVVLAIVVLILIIRDHKKLTEKKRSIICCVGLFVFCGLEIWMCASTVSDINAKRNAENSAVLFIKDKYGIDAEADYEKTFSSDVRKWTTVKMTADGKDFYVEQCTNNDNHTTIFADDYQLDEIKQAVFDEVSSVYPNGIRRDVRIYGRKLFFHEVIEKYFDGTNLDEVMECQHGYITIDFADTKFDLEDPLFEKLGEWSIRLYFTSFDTTEHLEDFIETAKIGFVYDDGKHYAKYAHYITDRVVYEYGEAGEKGKVIRKSYDIKSYGDFDYFYLWGNDDKSLTRSPVITEAENGSRDIEKKFANYDESQLIDKPISDVYELHGRSGSHFIYCPLENLSASDNIGVAWISYQSGIPDHGVAMASICGDYAVFTLPFDAYEFMMVDTSGTDKET